MRVLQASLAFQQQQQRSQTRTQRHRDRHDRRHDHRPTREAAEEEPHILQRMRARLSRQLAHPCLLTHTLVCTHPRTLVDHQVQRTDRGDDIRPSGRLRVRVIADSRTCGARRVLDAVHSLIAALVAR